MNMRLTLPARIKVVVAILLLVTGAFLASRAGWLAYSKSPRTPPAVIPAASVSPPVSPLNLRNASFALAPESVLSRPVGQAAAPLFVDIRLAQEYESFRIPGSLNIPLHAVRSKAFLKNKEFILLDAGHDYATLAKGCAALIEQGFAGAKVLAGGLVAWRGSGGALDGDPFALAAMDLIDPQS